MTISPPVDHVTSTSSSADPNAVPEARHLWTWTTFTSWSSCSATCGWGVQSAERFCVLVSGLHVVQAAPTVDPCLQQDVYHSNLITTSAGGISGAGLSSQKQYRRCEMPACLSPPPSYIPRVPPHHHNALDEFPMPAEGDPRFQLCADFDEKEFSQGTKYSWIPFQTGTYNSIVQQQKTYTIGKLCKSSARSRTECSRTKTSVFQLTLWNRNRQTRSGRFSKWRTLSADWTAKMRHSGKQSNWARSFLQVAQSSKQICQPMCATCENHFAENRRVLTVYYVWCVGSSRSMRPLMPTIQRAVLRVLRQPSARRTVL